MQPPKKTTLPADALKAAIAIEAQEFERAYRWLEKHLPPSFLEEVDTKTLGLLAHHLMSFQLQDRFSQIHLKQMAIVLCMDGPDADLNILKTYGSYAIHYYRTFVSNEPPPGEKEGLLRVALLHLREGETKHEGLRENLSPLFLRSLGGERTELALEVFGRAKERDDCQYEVRKIEDWEKKRAPSLQLMLGWRNAPKANFLFRLAKIVYRHGLALRRAAATYVDPHSEENILLLSVGLHGLKGGAAWEETDIDDFLREICLLKYFETDDSIDEVFVKSGLLTGNEAHLMRNIASFVHQALVHADPNLYSFENVNEALCRHPELSARLAQIFAVKFHPKKHSSSGLRKPGPLGPGNSHPNLGGVRNSSQIIPRPLGRGSSEEMRLEFLALIDQLDTGQALNDLRRKTVLKQALSFIDHCLKTNFYCANKTAFSFRFNPEYLNHLPYDGREKFPELPYGIFFVRGMHFIGFNIRFRDLARGGVRTVTPERWEAYFHERNNIFSEAYNLAYTQQKKNKDIPEGGSKTAILLAPFDVFSKEVEIYAKEMESDGLESSLINERLALYRQKQKRAYLFASQRAFIESFMTLLNCNEQGKLKADDVVDLWKRPEYIYLGPDENMLNEMIVWITDYAVACGYKPGRSFMTSKPGAGINHKEYGVTSYGVNVYLHQALLFAGIDPDKTPFTVKISGGPDGDVAGNEIHILATRYAKTAKLLALTDISGTIFDPEGLDWKEMDTLFQQGKPIRCYPPEKLHDNGLLLDLSERREESAYVQQTLCWRKTNGKLHQEWLSGNEMNHLYRTNVHQTKADAFIPGGGRPRTLNESNYTTFLDQASKPTSKIIVEGANLYLTPNARRALEQLGVIVIKDSSCNKGGVICSSFEVLAALSLSEEEFLREKEPFVKEVLEIIRTAALQEANLLLDTHRKTGAFLTDLSDKVSERINFYKYQLLDHLEHVNLSHDPKDPLIRCLLLYCPPLLRTRYADRILRMPDIHKKAIISVFLASHLVYTKGLDWAPSIADVLDSVAQDFT
ncbi:MAG: NAD-glutamate dehydrogenase [Verrucomicrobiota bacterium]|nr:NAD-glutamate dehydrogenase [Verrucomicrobiota bacterium]